MKTKKLRLLPLLLALALLPGILPVRAAAPEYQNTYVNTGNQRADILGVALTQVGYTEGENNNTKYGDWMDLPYQPWCASFISWCARQAEISTQILHRSGLAWPSYYGIPYYSGQHYTPRPGDLFFTEDFTHVGLVYQVEGEYFKTIEGNSNLDGSEDGYYVVINERLIRDYHFGVPAYAGAEGHAYVRIQAEAHPHAIRYECRDCGDGFDTGYTAMVDGCGKCLGCGCDDRYAGYYLCASGWMPLRIWEGHSKTGTPLGRIGDGAVVRVFGGTSDGWACVEYDGIRGHVERDKLTAYYPAPAAPVIAADRAEYVWGDDVTLSWNADTAAEEYRLEILRDGVTVTEEAMGTARSFTLPAAPAGNYEVRVCAANRTGWSPEGVLHVLVRDTYTVTYDAAGGTNVPGCQTEVCGTALTLTDAAPSLDGFTFLGWTDEAGGSFAKYAPGSALMADEDVTLRAVWKDNNAAPQTLEIAHAPLRTQFVLGESLDTRELALRITYSDGTGYIVTGGYTTEGYTPDALGVQDVTVLCQGLAVTYPVEIVDCIPGDIDRDTCVTREDVMQLLWHITFPAEFPIESPADFTGDSRVDRDDVMQLLWHITFPNEFPLDVYIN